MVPDSIYPPERKRNYVFFLFIEKLIARINKRQALIFFTILIGLFIIFLLVRNPILRFLSGKINSSLIKSTGLTLSWKEISFTGFKTVTINELCILGDSQKRADTLCFVRKIELTPAYISFLFGRKRIRTCHLEKGFFQLSNFPSCAENNLNSKEKAISGLEKSDKINFEQGLDALINKIRKYLPRKFSCRDFKFILPEKVNGSIFECYSLELQGKQLMGKFRYVESTLFRKFSLYGEVDKRKKKLSLYAFPDSACGIRIPFLKHYFQAELGFDTLEISLRAGKSIAGMIPIFLDARSTGFMVQHKAISPDPVIINKGELRLKFLAGKERLELDSVSDIGFNGFHFNPWVVYHVDRCKTLEFKILPIEFQADSLLNSIPQNLFTNFTGMRTTGALKFQLYARIPLECPDSAKFDCTLDEDKFRILQYGISDFRKLGGSFNHDIFEKDQYIRSFVVGSENPEFTPLNEISPLLVSSVLTSEDGAFYWHHGFNPEAFRDALAENIREKRFVRGGSTISMQLVKNVFLTGKKTIARKAEEAFIVWLIESLNLVSKERMLEVYLNLIEWGPGIYGIGPASRFYFNKLPRDLNLQESIFLAAIVPRPKSFRYTFVQNGELKSYMAQYYKVLEEHLIKQQKISAEDTLGLKPHVWLSGEARYQLKVQDSIRVDTVFPELEQIPLLNISNFPLNTP